MNKINKNNIKMTFFCQKICHIANYILTLQSFLTNINLKNMNTNKLKKLNEPCRSDLYWSLNIIDAINNEYDFLSRTEKRQLEIQINQIKEIYDNL